MGIWKRASRDLKHDGKPRHSKKGRSRKPVVPEFRGEPIMGKRDEDSQPVQDDGVTQAAEEFDADALIEQMEVTQADTEVPANVTEDEPLDTALAEAAEMLDQATLESTDDDPAVAGADELAAAMAELSEYTEESLDEVAELIEQSDEQQPVAEAEPQSALPEAVSASEVVEAVADTPDGVTEAVEMLATTVDEMAETVDAITDVVGGPPAEGSLAGSSSSANELRGRLTQVKEALTNDLDQALNLLSEVDVQLQQAETDRARAEEYKKAAEQARAASKVVTAAQQKANTARSAWEATQQKLETAQHDWQTKQQAAADAAV